MQKYFTNLEIENNMFTGTVFDANTNQELYKTKPYNAQSKAMEDINNFITNQKTTKDVPSLIPETIVNTTAPIQNNQTVARRCCGR
jgi:hypothetical protein